VATPHDSRKVLDFRDITRRRSHGLIALVLIAVLPSGPAVAQEPVRVVASMSVVADIARAVGAERLVLTTLVGPDSDAHVYQPRPSDARAVAAAHAVVINGLGLDGWMTRLMDSAGARAKVIVASDGTRRETAPQDGHGHGPGHGHDHAPGTVDPHAWQSLANGQTYAANIARGLAEVDPAHAELYRRNADAYRHQLGELDQWVRKTIGTVPAAKRKVITTHDAFRHFGKAYGVSFLAPLGLSTESEPSAVGMAQLVRQMKREGVKALFIENMSDPRLLEQLARDAGAVVGGRLYADALSGPDGPAPTYLKMFEHNTATLVSGMVRN
jgi:zinc/manganese transport system substrate-binding protein